MPPLKVVLILKYHYPWSEIDGDFKDPRFFAMVSDFYRVLGMVDRKVIFAISPSFFNQIREMSRGNWQDGEWEKEFLPPGFPQDEPKRSWRTMASSIPGKLIAMVSSGKVEIAALPLYSPPIGLLVDSGFEKHAKDQVQLAISQFSEIFGSVDCVYPPILDISGGSASVIPKGFFSFANQEVLERPSEISSVKFVPVDWGVSERIYGVQNEEELVEILEKLHMYQRLGKSGLAIVVDARKWLNKPWDVKEGILKAIFNDPYIELVFPRDLSYSRGEYLNRYTIYGKPDSFYMRDSVLRLWELYKGIFVTYLKSSSYMAPQKREKAKNLLYALEDVTFYESAGKNNTGSILDLFDMLAKKLYELLGEDTSSLPKASEFANLQVNLRRIDSSPVINGVEDEGFWVYSKVFSSGKMTLKLVLLKRGLYLSVFPGKDAKDLLGESRILVVKVKDEEYRVYFKVWRNRIYVFKKQVLSGKLVKGFGIWKNVEMLLNEKLPVDISVELLDSRSRKVLFRIPSRGYIRLDERR